jgi:glycosyltransferase involved in cell wall biosynthesis
MELKIAILGTRGIPNNYGGFEHIAGHLAAGLVEKGHEVTVYSSSRHPYKEKIWKGVNIIHCFDPEYLIGVPGQFIYDLNCILDTRNKNFDIILMLGYTSSSVWGFLYPAHSIVITNMDGLEWKRAKYSRPVRKFLKLAERLAVLSSRFHIADSPVIKSYLDNEYGINCRYIAYGAAEDTVTDEQVLAGYGIKKQDYFLLMARMEPENNIEMILDGFCMTAIEKPFIVIGNTANGYGQFLLNKYKNEKRIVFTGAIFDEQKAGSLISYCSLYFHGHSVGGTNPSLLEAMALRAPLAIHDNAFNKAVVNENALTFFRAGEVRDLLNAGRYLNPVHVKNNYDRISAEYSWKQITEQYENYFLECRYAGRKSYLPLKHEQDIFYKRHY